MPKKEFSSTDNKSRDVRPKNFPGGIEHFSTFLSRSRTVSSEKAPICDEAKQVAKEGVLWC